MNALAVGDSRSVDAFRARFRGPDGAPVERCFFNAASFGIGAVAALGVQGWRRRLPGFVRYLSAAVPPLARGLSFQVTLRLDDAPPAAFEITTAAVANGQYQGGGIRIAPEAAIDDGLADVTVVERVSLTEVTVHLPILYSGALYTHPKVRHWRAARVRVAAETEVPWNSTANPSERCRSTSKRSRGRFGSSFRRSAIAFACEAKLRSFLGAEIGTSRRGLRGRRYFLARIACIKLSVSRTLAAMPRNRRP